MVTSAARYCTVFGDYRFNQENLCLPKTAVIGITRPASLGATAAAGLLGRQDSSDILHRFYVLRVLHELLIITP